MGATTNDKKLETLSGQIEALRVVVVALALMIERKAEFRNLVQELLNSQRELLLSQAVSEEFLAGLELAGELMLKLFPPEEV